jgi:hypothetical protein
MEKREEGQGDVWDWLGEGEATGLTEKDTGEWLEQGKAPV